MDKRNVMKYNMSLVTDFIDHTNKFISLFDDLYVFGMVNSYLCRIEDLQKDVSRILSLQGDTVRVNRFFWGYSLEQVELDWYYNRFVDLAKKIWDICSKTIREGCLGAQCFMCYTWDLIVIYGCGWTCDNCKIQHVESNNKTKINEIIVMLDDLKDKLKELDSNVQTTNT